MALLAWSVILLASGCGGTGTSAPWEVRIASAFPHDEQAYTQGLLFRDGKLYESTGLYRESTVREVDPMTGRVVRKLDLPSNVFGEGLAWHGDRLFVLTWRERTAYEIDPATFAVVKTFSYEGEGWGLTSDGERLIMSDGTSTLRFLNPADFSVVRTVRVTQGGQPVMNLNELEFVAGDLLANIYQEDRIVRIDADSGKVTAELDLSALRSRLPSPNRAEVLNGIAVHPDNGHLYVTGKRWPMMFELVTAEE